MHVFKGEPVCTINIEPIVEMIVLLILLSIKYVYSMFSMRTSMYYSSYIMESMVILYCTSMYQGMVVACSQCVPKRRFFILTGSVSKWQLHHVMVAFMLDRYVLINSEIVL